MFKRLLLGSVLVLPVLQAHAAEFKIVRDSEPGAFDIEMKGDIVPGDHARLLARADTVISGMRSYLRRIILESDGGSVGEALDIGYYIRYVQLETFAPKVCASA